jgi:putative holliday junction resolvase
MRLLACDYGRARIGIAHSDEGQRLATPLVTCKRHKRLEVTFQEIRTKILFLGKIEAIVIGLPLLLNGQEGEMAKEAKEFGTKLSAYLGIPCLFWDERLSSSQAERLMKEGLLSRKERSSLSDTLSATLILQNYLDFLQRPQRG